MPVKQSIIDKLTAEANEQDIQYMEFADAGNLMMANKCRSWAGGVRYALSLLREEPRQGSTLIGFYTGQFPDAEGRYIWEVLGFSENKLECEHSYIQLLFPLPEKSKYHPEVPTLTENDIRVFKSNPTIQNNMKLALDRMRQFYFTNSHWIFPKDHNFLRITRILKCLTLCGLRTEAVKFLTDLKGIEGIAEVAGESMDFWDAAVKELV